MNGLLKKVNMKLSSVSGVKTDQLKKVELSVIHLSSFLIDQVV